MGLGAMGVGVIGSKGENPFEAVGSKGLGAIDAIGSNGLGAKGAIGLCSKSSIGFDLSSKGLNTCCFSRITNPGKKSSLFIKLIDSIDL
jgi:hypothetical protein